MRGGALAAETSGRAARTAGLLAGGFGLLFAAVTPPCRAPDEPAHFRRAYAISEGQIFAERRSGLAGGEVPASVVDVMHRFLTDPTLRPGGRARPARILAEGGAALRPDVRRFVPFPNTALYSPVAYAPQALALAAGRRLTESVLALFYLARAADAVAAGLLLALSVALAPPGARALFLFLGLLPMPVFLAGSSSADPVTTGLSFLLTAAVLRCAFGPRPRVRGGDIALLAFLAVLLGWSKPGYFPLAALAFWIPAERFGSRARKRLVCTLVLAAAVAATALWAAAVHGRGLVAPPRDPAEVLRSAPGVVAGRMIADHLRRLPATAAGFIGVLGLGDVPLPRPLLVLNALALLVVAATSSVAPRFGVGRRLVAGIAVAAAVLLVTLPYYAPLIAPGPEGASAHRFQGRYLLPLGPAAFLILSAGRPIGGRRLDRWVAVWAALVLAISAAVLAARHYL